MNLFYAFILCVVGMWFLGKIGSGKQRAGTKRLNKLIGSQKDQDAFTFDKVSDEAFGLHGSRGGWLTRGSVELDVDVATFRLQVSRMDQRPPLLNFAMGSDHLHSLRLLKGDSMEHVTPHHKGLATMRLAMGHDLSQMNILGYTYTANLSDVLSLLSGQQDAKDLNTAGLLTFVEHIVVKDSAVEIVGVMSMKAFLRYADTRNGLIALCAHLHDWATSLFHPDSDILTNQLTDILKLEDTQSLVPIKRLAMYSLLAHAPKLEPGQGDWLNVLAHALCATSSLEPHASHNLSPAICQRIPSSTLLNWYGQLTSKKVLLRHEHAALDMVQHELTPRFRIEHIRSTRALPWQASPEELARLNHASYSVSVLCEMIPLWGVPLAVELWFLNIPERCKDPTHWRTMLSLTTRCPPKQERHLLQAIQRAPHLQDKLAHGLNELIKAGHFTHPPLMWFVASTLNIQPPENEALWMKLLDDLELDFMLVGLLKHFELSSSWRLLVGMSKSNRHGEPLRQNTVFGMKVFQLYTSLFTQPPTQEMKRHAGSLAQLFNMLCHNNKWLEIHENHRNKFDEMCEGTLTFFDGEPITAEVFMAFKELLERAPLSLKKPLTQALTRWEHQGIRGGLMEVGQNSQGGLTLDS